ncbi:MAG TPA: glycosyl transferase [Rhodobacteraceae bacterium]|jgi:GT2 family glycosyltransferase|nr:glycosyl transferase [Paracoccaceae bacterium]HBV56261.1 glycosyl transferase [Paracoccaceae bacterium]
MTQDRPTISVVIVSRGRPASLSLCLMGVARLVYAPYEIVVVADALGLEAARALPFAAALKLVAFDEANISAARNAGVLAAGGEIIAFIDDDAVPEPAWLAHFAAAFAQFNCAAVGGYVRGRNGISWQWRARSVDETGRAFALDMPSSEPFLPIVPAGQSVKTEGTNMAVRRDILCALGGFDPSFRFYLDETDLNRRLGLAGHKTVLVPLAEVHHAYGPSDLRRGDRAVRDLTQIGASSAIFLRRHAPPDTHRPRLDEIRTEQRRRLTQQMVDGLIEPRDLPRLMATLERGIAQGLSTGLSTGLEPLIAMPPSAPSFSPFESLSTGQHHVLAGRFWRVRSIRRDAERLAREGHIVSVFVFSRTFLFHSVRYLAPGIWWQSGGLWGRSERKFSRRQFHLFTKRVDIERVRVARARGL